MTKNTSVLRTIIIAFAIIASAFSLSRAWIKTHSGRNEISVTGLASKDFASDLIVWNGRFSRRATTTKEAYTNLKNDVEILKKYMLDKGVSENEIVFSAVNIDKEYTTTTNKDGAQTSIFWGYTLSQNIEIESNQVGKIEKVSREITEMIDLGIEFYSTNPNYYYTKLANLKIEMLAQATKDARLRAEKIAENAGGSIGKLKQADMGIFQITAQNGNEEYSWGGAFNTSSKNKTATITVKLLFESN